MKNIFIILALVLAITACQPPQKEQNQTTAPETITETTAKTVKVTTIGFDTIPVINKYTATINAYDKVYLAPNMPGRIKNVMVEINDKVRKGQPVIQMDDTQLTQLKVQHKTLVKEMARMDTLITYGAVSQQIYDQTQSQYETTKANLANLSENTKMVSPFSGIVTGKFYENNEIYSGAPNTPAGKAAIVTIEQIERLKVLINVSENYFPKVANGMETKLTTDIYPGKTFIGKVSLIYPTIDPQTRTFTVEVTIPNAELSLRPGMFAKVELYLGKKSAIMAPSAAVMIQDGTADRYVFTNNNGVAKRINVTIGERFDDMLEIISPDLKVGQKLIVSGQTKLDNGDQLTVVQ